MPQLTATQTKLLQKLNLDPSDPNLKAKIRNILDKQGQKPQPLPNLEFKFVCANSLVGIKEAEGLEDSEIPLLRDELKRIRQDTFKSGADKQKLQKEWKETTDKLFELQIKSGFYDQSSTNLALWNPYEKTPAEFFDPQWMFGVEANTVSPQGGFDLVIGNPPYVQLQKDGGKLGKQFEKLGFKTFTKSGDLYQLFYEKGYDLLKPNGLLSYITSNKWMRAGYGKTTREFFATQTNPKIVIDLGANVFESATVDSNIIVLQKAKNQGQTKATKASKQELEKGNPKFATINFDSSEGWFIGSSDEIKLKKKIESVGKPLKEWDVKINYGIKTGLNEAFIIDEEKKNELIAKDPKSAEIIKPILRGRDIKRYGYEFANLYLLFIPWHFPLHKNPNITGVSLEAEKEFEKQYSAIYHHLLEHKEKLSKRNKSETGIRYEWYALQRCANTYYEEFEKEKVVYSEIVREPQFYLDKSGDFFAEATSFLMTGKNMKFFCGLLNSKPFTYFFKNFYAGGGLGQTGYRYKKVFLENVPIPILDTPQKQQTAKKIEVLVEEILLIKNGEFKMQNGENTPSPTEPPLLGKGELDTLHLEKQIDELVFELYGLSEEEIGVVVG